MSLYYNEIQEEINKEGVLKNANQIKKDDFIIFVIVEEGWIYKITEKEVEYLGNREENPEPPQLEEGDILFEYIPNEWTKENVKVIITTKIEGYSLQYAIENPEDETSWKKYDTNEEIIVTENKPIYARLINNLGEVTQKYATGNISNIDRIDPEISDIVVETVTTNSVQIKVLASDNSGKLAIKDTYQYNLNGKHVTSLSENSYTFTNLAGNTQYTIKVTVTDMAGNTTEKSIEVETSSLIVRDGLLKEVSKIKSSGNHSVKVQGVTYDLDVKYFSGNLNITPGTSIAGTSWSSDWSNVLLVGNAEDVGSASKDASRMVVLKVDGNLTIAKGITLAPYVVLNGYGGPKGFLIYCGGTLTNNRNNYY